MFLGFPFWRQQSLQGSAEPEKVIDTFVDLMETPSQDLLVLGLVACTSLPVGGGEQLPDVGEA